MNITQNDIIKWECNNWCLRPDGLIQITTSDAGKIILNSKYSKIWTTIDYEVRLSDLWEQVKDTVLYEELVDIIKKLKLNDLVSIVNEENEFDVIFG